MKGVRLLASGRGMWLIAVPLGNKLGIFPPKHLALPFSRNPTVRSRTRGLRFPCYGAVDPILPGNTQLPVQGGWVADESYK